MNVLVHAVLLALVTGSAWYLILAMRNSSRSGRYYPLHMLVAALVLLASLCGLSPGVL